MQKWIYPLFLVFACAPELEPGGELAEQASAFSTYSYTDPVWLTAGKEASTVLPDACPSDRWIGYLIASSPGPCPAMAAGAGGTWARSKLLLSSSGALPTPLQRFCLYQWTSPGSGPPDTSVLVAGPNMRLERDCKVAIPLYLPEDATTAVVQAAYAEQVDAPRFAVGAPASLDHVRIAIVDNATEETTLGLPSRGSTLHGFTMGTVARENSCIHRTDGSTDCPVFIASHRALTLNNGNLGYPSEVARAIIRAVDGWIAGVEPHMIVNLSIGWHARFSAMHGPTMRLTALAVWHAVQLARCEGALIVAAAGNRSSTEEDGGPMFPAGWEQESELVCGGGIGYQPLVHAAGGVDGADHPLAVARDGGTPRIVAASAFVAVEGINPSSGDPQTTTFLSGTSLAAAGVSGAAALIWSRNPGLTGHEVMETLYQHGEPLGVDSDFAGQNLVFEQHRLDICAAAACDGLSCPLACPLRNAGESAAADFAEVLDIEYPGLRTGRPINGTSATNTTPISGVEITSSPFAGTQPSVPMCPVCSAGASFIGKLALFPGESITKLVLHTEPSAYDIQITIVDPDQSFKVSLEPFDLSTEDSAILQATIHGASGKDTIYASEIALDY